MQFHRILALTDLSENSIAGLRLAECLARRWKTRVVVGYAHTRSDILSGFGRSTEDLQRLADWVHNEHEEHLANLAHEHINELRLESIETVDAESPREGVHQLLERVKPDLVCMATHGRSGVKHLLLGSIAEHTLRTAGIPVVVTKGAPMPAVGEPLRVLLGLDLLEDPTVLVKTVAEHLGPKDELLLGHMVESWYYSPIAYGSEFALTAARRAEADRERDHAHGQDRPRRGRSDAVGARRGRPARRGPARAGREAATARGRGAHARTTRVRPHDAGLRVRVVGQTLQRRRAGLPQGRLSRYLSTRMLTETAVTGLRALIHLAQEDSTAPLSPKRIAAALDVSPSYMAKIAGALARSEIVDSQRGAKGGIRLVRDPKSITLREVVEACQGKILGDYCEETRSLRHVCAFHRAMVELHEATTEVLHRWTLADLIACPSPSRSLAARVACRMQAPR